VNVYLSAVTTALVPDGVTTCTLTTPAACAGVLAVIFVLDTATTLVAALVPNFTADAPVKFDPVIVTA
jgi:hypothetical protein